MKSERGQSIVEYVIIALIVLVVLYFAADFIGPMIKSIFDTINDSLSGISR